MSEEIKSTLPKGWKRENAVRKNGLSKGKVDVYIKSPKGKTFRSKKNHLNICLEKNCLKIDDCK